MNEYRLILGSKTENKLRWNGDIGCLTFKLYIPKTVVPDPVPQVIRVAVEHGGAIDGPGYQARTASGLRALVEFVAEYMETGRYRPVGESRDWIIGEPYIPQAILPTSRPDRVGIILRWQ